MAHAEKLPWELIEEILLRVPPTSLVRFKAVSKPWKALFEDKMFMNNHKAMFRFILATKSKIYSVSVDPKIEVRELTLEIPGLDSQIPKKLVDCNGYLLCVMGKGAVVWNPWLKKTRWIEPEVNQPSLQFDGMGYEFDNGTPEEDGYKTLASYKKESEPTKTLWKLHDLASDAWKDHENSGYTNQGGKSGGTLTLHTTSAVSLLGNLYWIAYYDKTDDPLLALVYFTFSTGRFYKPGDLPCERNHHRDALVLRAYKGDRLSLLKQCHLTKKIEVWVTKNKINDSCHTNIEWVNFMEFSIPKLPDLVQSGSTFQPSYFIDVKKLVVCSCDETGRAWIYVFGEKKLISKTQINSVVDAWPLHCTYFPSLVPVPRGKREEVELQV